MGVDRRGNLYVANRGGGVTVYPPEAEGDVAPLRTLCAGGRVEALVVGAGGDLFVSLWPNGNTAGGPASILHFPQERQRSDYAISGPRTALTYPVGLALGADRTLHVANAFGGVVAAFAPDARGDVAPLRRFTAATSSTQALACGAGVLLLSGSAVYVYADPADPVGRPQPAAVFARSSRLPLQCASGVAIDVHSTPPIVCIADYAANLVHVVRTSGVAPRLAVAAVTTLGRATAG